jgi:phosphate transport system protein
MAERFFHEELQALKQKLMIMGSLVQTAIDKSVHALIERNGILAEEVIENEKIINQLEIKIDEAGHKCLALGQPMAVDLRLITVILKINTDLERMGDHAVNIAERALKMLREPALDRYVQAPEMAKVAQKMLSDALLSFQKGDAELARSVLCRDDEVDAYNDNLYLDIEEVLQKDPSITKAGMNLLMIGHNLERIADLANNIAEDVIYLKEGKEVRHRMADR